MHKWNILHPNYYTIAQKKIIHIEILKESVGLKLPVECKQLKVICKTSIEKK